MTNHFLTWTGLTASAVIGTKIFNKALSFYQGNSAKISSKNISFTNKFNLENKKICFLGSSITYGAGSFGDSFPDYLAAKDGVKVIKEAVSGTTLGGRSEKTYTSRLKNNISTEQDFDLFVCQLSTNDGRFSIPLGKISDSFSLNDFDRSTTIGAMEYIIAYVKQTWDCPIAFYTCLRKPDKGYEDLIHILYQLKDKWNIKIIDVGQNVQVKVATNSSAIYMFDDAHPTRAGYRYIWLPFFENALQKIFLQLSEENEAGKKLSLKE